ncbi:MAG: hypothetical protein V8R55_14275 [Dysosmobacter sp.]
MDEVIYVSDLETYELYYLNPAGRRLTGVSDYQGQKCYKVLQGRTDPCDFCTNHCLRRDSFYVWERENKVLNGYFMLKDKLIPWRGKWRGWKLPSTFPSTRWSARKSGRSWTLRKAFWPAPRYW